MSKACGKRPPLSSTNSPRHPNGNRSRRRALLKVVDGGRTRRLGWDGGAIIVAPTDAPPFDLDARVFEEDTFRIMSADPQWAPPEVHPIRLMHELQRYEPDQPGSVVVQAGRPMGLLAIVHDVNCDPTWRAAWIATALRQIMHAAARFHLQSLGLPLLGRQHGRMPRTAFIDLLVGVLKNRRSSYPWRLWLMVSDPADVDVVFAALRDRLRPDGIASRPHAK